MSLAKTVLIAPVGYYEKRLHSAIFQASPQRVYLLKSTGVLAGVTDYVADSIKTTIPLSVEVDDSIRVDYNDIEKIDETLVMLVRRERKMDRTSRIVVDVTSATKDFLLAATQLSQVYNLQVSYVPASKKFEWMEAIESPQKFLEREPIKAEREDPGGNLGRYSFSPSNLGKDDYRVLSQLSKKAEYPSVYSLSQDLTRQTKRGARQNTSSLRYWSRLIHRLEDTGLIDVEEYQDTQEKRVRLSSAGRGIVGGLVKAGEKLDQLAGN